MKKKPRKLLLMIVLVIMVMSFTVTGLAYDYSGVFTNYCETQGTVRIINYVKDNNSYANVFIPGVPVGPCYYSSRAYVDGEDNPYSTIKMYSGWIRYHYHPDRPFDAEDDVRGKLRFVNSYCSGYTMNIAGAMS